MRPRPGIIVCATLALCALPTVGAQADTSGSISASFAPDRAGAPAALTMVLTYTGTSENVGPSDNVPTAVRRTVVHLPGGLGLFPPRGSRTCSRARLQAHGPTGCPASAKVGTGKAVLGAHLGTLNLNESASLTAWAGPEQGINPTLEIAGQGLSPLEERVVVTAVLLPDKPPYGMELVLTTPPIPTLPTEPDASMLRFSLTLGSTRHGSAAGAGLVHVPSRCPAGGFPFAASFTYADGSTGAAATKVHCP